jgi:hypothetical protein
VSDTQPKFRMTGKDFFDKEPFLILLAKVLRKYGHVSVDDQPNQAAGSYEKRRALDGDATSSILNSAIKEVSD